MKKPFIIPIFIPHAGCPHRCVFCNQNQITGINRAMPTQEAIEHTIESHLNFKPANRTKTQVSFFGGNFLGLSVPLIRHLLEIIRPYILSGQVDGIRCSTRPDTITGDRLSILAEFAVSTIELGVQSMDDAVLNLSNRGHTAYDTQIAMHRLKKEKYETGIQMMVGLPGDTEKTALDTTQKIIDLMPDFVRIYPTIVLSGSRLADWYKNGRYTPMPLEECVSLVKRIYVLFRGKNIPVIRMGIQTTPELEENKTVLAGPYHPAFGHLVYSEIFLEGILKALPGHDSASGELALRVHPKTTSIVRGIKNQNVHTLIQKYSFESVKITSDDAIPKNAVMVFDRLVYLPL